MTILYAQPYDISANGFFFESVEEYGSKRKKCLNSFGGEVEEFEIQFIDGEDLDYVLFKALSVHQGDIETFFNACSEWHEYQKINVIIAVGECGYNFDNSDPDDFEVDLYDVATLKELAEQFVEEGLFGEIPENIRFYLDYEAIARDLSMDYTKIHLNGTNYIYRMA